jgi:hypothetical protein
MATGCALDTDGNLKNASDIEFFESKTDSHPIGHRAAIHPTHGNVGKPEKRKETGSCSSFVVICDS